MSGIYCIYRYDGAPVDRSWLERMRTAMAYCGPDGGGSIVEGPVGMGHLLLDVNPEDAFENRSAWGERGVVVSAARLDNRAALMLEFLLRVPDDQFYRRGQRSFPIRRALRNRLPDLVIEGRREGASGRGRWPSDSSRIACVSRISEFSGFIAGGTGCPRHTPAPALSGRSCRKGRSR